MICTIFLLSCLTLNANAKDLAVVYKVKGLYADDECKEDNWCNYDDDDANYADCDDLSDKMNEDTEDYTTDCDDEQWSESSVIGSSRISCKSTTAIQMEFFESDDCTGDLIDHEDVAAEQGQPAAYFEHVEGGNTIIETGCYGSSHELWLLLLLSLDCGDDCPEDTPDSVKLDVQCATGALGKILGATGLSVWLILLILVLVGLFIFGVVVGILKYLGLGPFAGGNTEEVPE